MKAKLLRLQGFAERNQKKLAAASFALVPLFAHAEVTTADIAPVVLAIMGSIALIVLIGNAKLLVKVAVRTYSWLASAIR